jgi:hypothetical protein
LGFGVGRVVAVFGLFGFDGGVVDVDVVDDVDGEGVLVDEVDANRTLLTTTARRRKAKLIAQKKKKTKLFFLFFFEKTQIQI